MDLGGGWTSTGRQVRYIEVSKWMSNSLRKSELKIAGGRESVRRSCCNACLVFPFP